MINEIMQEFDKFSILSHTLPNALGLWRNEAECLVWGALNSPSRSNWIEIGSFCGGSAVLLCLTRKSINAGPHVISVDNNYKHIFDENVYRRGKFYDIHKKLTIDSSDLSKYLDFAVGFVFIDGFHSFRQIIIDFNQVYNKLDENAIIMFHDASPYIHNPNYRHDMLKYFINTNYEKLFEDKSQNFMVDAAIIKICEDFKFEIINIPVQTDEVHLKETGLIQWIQGKTSPFNSIVAIKKK